MIKPVFNIISIIQQQDRIEVMLDIEMSSEVFQGHFPNQPVVPGACMLQMLKDVLADALKIKPRLLKADNIKFLTLLTPSTGCLQLNINFQQINEQLKVNANLLADEIISMKFSGIFSC